MLNFSELTFPLLNNISSKKNLEFINLSLPDPPSTELFQSGKEKTGVDWSNTFYSWCDGISFNWSVKNSTDDEVNGYVMGAVKILSLEKMSQDWNLDRDFSNMKDFFILDFFTEETCVGFYKGLDYLYLYDMSGNPERLSLDFNGYFQMCIAAQGFLYWPMIVRSFIEGKPNHTSELYQKHMPSLFEGSSLEKLRDTYEKVKIK